jgi:hypothetical protein
MEYGAESLDDHRDVQTVRCAPQSIHELCTKVIDSAQRATGVLGELGDAR